MTKTIIDIYYQQDLPGIYVEDTLYVEDGKQYLKSTLVELDPAELKNNYYNILHMTCNIARFNERPVHIYNEFSNSITEHTTEDQFDWYGDHRTLEDYTDTHYNQYHQSIIDQQIANEQEMDRILDKMS